MLNKRFETWSKPSAFRNGILGRMDEPFAKKQPTLGKLAVAQLKDA